MYLLNKIQKITLTVSKFKWVKLKFGYIKEKAMNVKPRFF